MFSFVRSRISKCVFFTILLCFQTLAHVSAQQETGSSKEFGDWTLNCESANGCFLFQRTAYQDTGKQISRINITKKPDSEDYNMTFILPLGMSFEKPAELKLDERRAKKLTVDYCLSQGCYSAIALNGGLIKKMDRAESGSVDVKTWKGEPFSIPLSPLGIKQGLEALSAQ